jgi:hypothetical protein
MPPARGPRWPYVLATLALILGFLAVWGLAGLVFGLGTCGEDSDITPEEYARLCEPGGRIARNLIVIAVAAVIVTVGLGAAAIRRREARPILVLTALLTVAGAASLAADRL